jgi:predicted permease
MQQGKSAEQARASAVREFGNVVLVKEVTRDMWGFRWLETVLQDLRYAARGLRRSPAFSLVVVLTLALGIGANSALFSLVYAAALRPLPFTHADRLVWVSTGTAAKARAAHGVSGQELREWQPRLEEIFDQFATFGGNYDTTWRRGEQGMHLASRSVGGNFFSLLGARAWAGRLFTPDDAQAGHGAVAVLGYDFWRRQFGGDLGILGQQMSERGGDYASYVIVGILPPQFVWDGATDVWLPEQPQTSYLAGLRDYRPFRIVGRLRAGVHLAGSRAAMDVLARQEAVTHPASNAGWNIRLELVSDHLHAGGQQGLLLLWAAAGCLLLTACVNVANLLLARARARQGEIAMRLALGASRRRLVAQLLTESGLLALLGAAVGWAWAAAAIRLLAVWGSWFLPPTLLRSLVGLHAGAMQPSVLAFTTLTAALAVVAFGLVPALRGSRPALSHAAPKQRLVRGLVVAEVALTTLLVVCAGLLIHSFTRLLAVDPGFASANRLTFSIELPRPPETAAPTRNNVVQFQRKAAWFAELEQRLQALPGVRAVGAADDLPILGETGGWEGYRSMARRSRTTPRWLS